MVDAQSEIAQKRDIGETGRQDKNGRVHEDS